MATSRIFVRPRTQVVATAWERWKFAIYMEVGVGSGNWQWVEFDPMTCRAGMFLQSFAALNIPGFPAWDPASQSMRRQRTYRGLEYPTSR